MIRALVVSLGVALALAPGVGAAHSLLLEASPAADALLPAPPAEIALRFNNRIEKRLSRVHLVDGRGDRRVLVVMTEDQPVDELHASMPALGPGDYRVEWQVLSTDGHVVNGVFSFRVAR